MNIHADTSKKNKSEAVANALRQNKHNSKTTFQFVDNRSEAIIQRKLQTIMQTNLPIKQLVATEDTTKQKDHSLPSDVPTETIQFVNKKKGAAIGGVLGGLGYAAFAVANSWNPLGLGMLAAAGVGALAGGILGNSEEPEPEHEHAQRSPRNIRERFHYDSEDLSDESGLSDASEQQEMVRAHGTRKERHLSVGVYSGPRAVRRTARSIRRFRSGEATESDRAPILTRVGSSVLEMAPSHWRRDVGVYQTEELPDGSRRRVGSATPYGSLGRELDRDRDDEGLSQGDMDEAMRGRLMGSPSSSGRVRSPAARRRLDEASGIMMSDMARGSRGAELADEMFEQPESFGRRFADRTGTYRPAHKGGSKYIQEETRERKKRDRGGSDSDTE